MSGYKLNNDRQNKDILSNVPPGSYQQGGDSNRQGMQSNMNEDVNDRYDIQGAFERYDNKGGNDMYTGTQDIKVPAHNVGGQRYADVMKTRTSEMQSDQQRQGQQQQQQQQQNNQQSTGRSQQE